MALNAQQIQALVSQGEGINLEFKTCAKQLNKDVYETICAFLNRNGGTLLLGVTDDGRINGITHDSLTQIHKDFVTSVNNPQRIMPPTHLSVETVFVEKKPLLIINVPESSQVHRCNGRIYDRNEDGDFDITDSTTRVAELYLRKQSSFSENRVYTWIQPNDLRADLIERCRRYVRTNHKNHPWAGMDDAQLLKSAQLIQMDVEKHKTGVTLAGVMLLGTDELILQVCPPHRTDCLLRKADVDRYDDRDLIRTNLLDSYDRILAFIQKHLPDPTYLEGVERRSLRDIIFREVASNLLIHREYSSGIPARLIIERGKVTTWNASRPHVFGVLDPTAIIPCPKNPVIGSFFREIGRTGEPGTGMPTMWKYGKLYGGADPQLIEDDVFRMVISVPEFCQQKVQHTDSRAGVVKFVTVAEIAKQWGVSERTVRRYCASGRISGAFLADSKWNIPVNAECPERVSKICLHTLLDRLQAEKEARLSGGIYHRVQIDLTYNSNHMEGSRLTHEQTRFIFETNTFSASEGPISVDDILETSSHFRCIDWIIDNAERPLCERDIKHLHFMLKNGTSDSRKEWFATGEYKRLQNEVGNRTTTAPEHVAEEMASLLAEYNAKKAVTVEDLIDFHVRFERIHPFQDGNGRIGRLLLFKECLRKAIVPFIIEDDLKMFYYRGLSEWDNMRGYLTDTCLTAQDRFKKTLDYFRIRY